MFIFVVASVLLIIYDNHLPMFAKVHSSLNVVVAPVQYLVSWPVEFVDFVENYLTSKRALLKENEKLRAEQLLLRAKVQQFIAIEQENTQLRALLSSAAHVSGKVLAAQVLAVNSDPFDQQIILDKGKKQGVYVGQPILDEGGVMGQVIAVGPITSRALLITSSRSAVPVQDNRNGIRSIVAGGEYAGDLRLLYISATMDVKPGDLLVTSGLGLKFPIGYPIGVISSVNYIAGQRFAEVKVTSSAKLNRSRQVLLVWPEQSQFLKPVKKMLKKS
jgi:rod shape-determining protein MreC